jgi:hypothetical protein
MGRCRRELMEMKCGSGDNCCDLAVPGILARCSEWRVD